MDISYYMKIQNAYGTKNKREKDLYNINHHMLNHFNDTIDTEDVLLNGNPFKLMILKDTDGNTYKKKIKSPHDMKFNLGDYVEWNNQTWMVTLLDSDEKTWNRGYMYLCTVLLRWQNEDGEIVERYGYSEDFTKYSTGVFSNNIMTLGDYQYGITLPVDDETKIIKRDKRFPIDIEGVEPPDVYKLTNRKILLTDDRSFNRGGVLTWTLSYSEFNPNTDKIVKLSDGSEVWICDYKSNTDNGTNQTQVTPLLNAEISGIKKIKIGYPRTYTVIFKDFDNKEFDWTKVSFLWKVESDFPLDYQVNGNKIQFNVDDDSLIGCSFLLKIIDANNQTILQETIQIIKGV